MLRHQLHPVDSKERCTILPMQILYTPSIAAIHRMTSINDVSKAGAQIKWWNWSGLIEREKMLQGWNANFSHCAIKEREKRGLAYRKESTLLLLPIYTPGVDIYTFHRKAAHHSTSAGQRQKAIHQTAQLDCRCSRKQQPRATVEDIQKPCDLAGVWLRCCRLICQAETRQSFFDDAFGSALSPAIAEWCAQGKGCLFIYDIFLCMESSSSPLPWSCSAERSDRNRETTPSPQKIKKNKVKSMFKKKRPKRKKWGNGAVEKMLLAGKKKEREIKSSSFLWSV